MQPHVKYWIKPDIEILIPRTARSQGLFQTRVAEITPDAIVVETPAGLETLRNDFVFAMTGYHPTSAFSLAWVSASVGLTGCRLQRGNARKQRPRHLSRG